MSSPTDEGRTEEAFQKLKRAVNGNLATSTLLAYWSSFVRQRDGQRCVLCRSRHGLSAHHICRKSFIDYVQYDTGNGISLCARCHKRPHAQFNRRPNVTLPMDEEGGEKIELMWELYEALYDHAQKRPVYREEYYSLNGRAVATFKLFQCLDPVVKLAKRSLEDVCLTWRQTPRPLLRALLAANGLNAPDEMLQSGPVMVYMKKDAHIK